MVPTLMLDPITVEKLVILFSGTTRDGEFQEVRQQLMVNADRPEYDVPMTEAQIEDLYDTQYDQEKVRAAGYTDECIDSLPHRYLKRWYITDRKTGDRRPLPLDKLTWPKNYVLSGWLEPAPSSSSSGSTTNQCKPVLCELAPLSYAMDRSPEYRGYWVYSHHGETARVLYWLQDPCDSQECLEWDSRVTLTIVSLLASRVFILADAKYKTGKTVKEVLTETPLVKSKKESAAEMLEFELQVLAIYKNSVTMHLIGLTAEMQKTCPFIKSLSNLSNTEAAPPLGREPIERWTKKGEKQLKQHAWGGPTREAGASCPFVASADRTLFKAIMNHEQQGNNDPALAAQIAAQVAEADDIAQETHLRLKMQARAAEKAGFADEEDEYRDSEGSDDADNKEAPDSSEQSRKRRHTGKHALLPAKKQKLEADGPARAIAVKQPLLDVSDETVLYSEEIMGREVDGHWGGYLAPKPGNDEFRKPWADILEKEFTIHEDVALAKEFYKHMAGLDLHRCRLEGALIAVESLNRTFREAESSDRLLHVCRLLFTLRVSENNRVPANFVFHDVQAQALGILGQRAAGGMIDTDETTATYVLCSIVDLVSNCHIIKAREQLELLQTRGIDLLACVEEIRDSYFKIFDENISAPVEKAIEHVKRMKKTHLIVKKKAHRRQKFTRKTPSQSQSPATLSNNPSDVIDKEVEDITHSRESPSDSEPHPAFTAATAKTSYNAVASNGPALPPLDTAGTQKMLTTLARSGHVVGARSDCADSVCSDRKPAASAHVARPDRLEGQEGFPVQQTAHALPEKKIPPVHDARQMKQCQSHNATTLQPFGLYGSPPGHQARQETRRTRKPAASAHVARSDRMESQSSSPLQQTAHALPARKIPEQMNTVNEQYPSHNATTDKPFGIDSSSYGHKARQETGRTAAMARHDVSVGTRGYLPDRPTRQPPQVDRSGAHIDTRRRNKRVGDYAPNAAVITHHAIRANVQTSRPPMNQRREVIAPPYQEAALRSGRSSQAERSQETYRHDSRRNDPNHASGIRPSVRGSTSGRPWYEHAPMGRDPRAGWHNEQLERERRSDHDLAWGQRDTTGPYRQAMRLQGGGYYQRDGSVSQAHLQSETEVKPNRSFSPVETTRS